MSVVERTAGFLSAHLSRRGFIHRAAMVATAVATGGALDLALRPGSAYGYICGCANMNCDCGSLCCNGYTEFCCTINGGYNYCPENTVIGGWWKADNSSYCGDGPRYYMDCNAKCSCTGGCGNGWAFCDPGCDGVSCSCAHHNCNNYMESCLQFRYGQCHQDDGCMGRIVCRVVACVPPWTIDSSCSNVAAVDESTAEQDRPCWTPARPEPPPTPECHSALTRCEVVGFDATGVSDGYRLVTSFGKVFALGTAKTYGDLSATPLSHPIAAIRGTADGIGYWLADAAGRVHAFGTARRLGWLSSPPGGPIVAMAATESGAGYRLAGADGAVYSFGDARFLGSLGHKPLSAPIVGIATTPSGNGYWLVGADGGVFAFGDATFHGSTGGIDLAKPIVAIAAHPDGHGYWLTASDGGVFAFGSAAFHGSAGATHLYRPVVAITTTQNGGGYWLAAADGGVFAFGAPFVGSVGG